MKSDSEIRAMIDKLMVKAKEMPWWEDGRESVLCSIDALLWVIGDRSGNPIDPDEWEKKDAGEN